MILYKHKFGGIKVTMMIGVLAVTTLLIHIIGKGMTLFCQMSLEDNNMPSLYHSHGMGKATLLHSQENGVIRDTALLKLRNKEEDKNEKQIKSD